MKLKSKMNLTLVSAGMLLASCGGTWVETTEGKAAIADSTETKKSETATATGEEVQYQSDTTTMNGYLAHPANVKGQKPGILIVHEWWGHNEYTRKRADMLADLGYVALAVDMYGNGKEAKHPDDAKKFSGMVMQNMPAAEKRFQAAYDLLASDPTVDPTKISAIGYCFGGSVVLAMANSGMPLDGVAAFHSGVEVPVAPSDKLQAMVLVQNGADDPFVSAASVENFKTRMDEINKPYEYIAYPGAVHAYTNPAADEMGKKFEMPLAYNREADEKSWDKLKVFLNKLYPDS